MHIFTRCKDTTIFANLCRKIDVFCTHCAFFVHIIKIRARVDRKMNTIYVAKHRFLVVLQTLTIILFFLHFLYLNICVYKKFFVPLHRI
jgi:hypothetical protein